MTKQIHPPTLSDTGPLNGENVYTPSSSLSPNVAGQPTSRQPSPLRISHIPGKSRKDIISDKKKSSQDNTDQYSSDDSDAYEMSNMNSTKGRPAGGLAQQPLLQDENRGRPKTRRTLSSQTPKYPSPADQTRKKYVYAAFFLILSLISFVVQTETAVYIQHELHWNKAYCMLWLTHGSWSLLFPAQLLVQRIQKRKQPWPVFWRRQKSLVTTTAQMVKHQVLYLSASTTSTSPWPYIIKTTMYITTFLTCAGASWYVAVNLTSPSDLTAIYNCSAFFAYVFSILLLKEKARLDKMFSVGLAIAGVLVVAYGDKDDTGSKSGGHSGGSTNPNPDPDTPPENRLLGNLIIGVGSVLYGFYEVLYKRYACPPEGTNPNRGMIFANTFGSMVGIFTLTVLWIPLPILHYTGLEIFELPTGKAAALLAVSTLSNAIFSGSFLVLMSLTSPVLSSVAALLTIFLVAITDWFITGKPLSIAAIAGGTLIIIAFIMLSWATYREMQEEARKRDRDGNNVGVIDDNEEDEEDTADTEENLGRRSTILVRGDEDVIDSDDEDGIDDEVGKRWHRES